MGNEFISALLRALNIFLSRYFTLAEQVVRQFYPSFELAIELTGRDRLTIDERIAKIDSARENLNDAIAAIDELRREADGNKAELEKALAQIATLEETRKRTEADIAVLDHVAKTDTEAFRRLVGVPTKTEVNRDRIFGFVSGVVASVVATILVLAATWIFSLIGVP
jgi:DNA repair exonuclease SbcCD ATPase subunit